MSYSQQSGISVPSTWLGLNTRATDLLLTISLVIVSLSFLAMATGEYRAVAFVATVGIAVVGLGITLIRLSEYLRQNR
ncbi:hypothetical protein SAMN05216226_108121 [Halovenus aranensis]|uniref:Uncharacterized protein n=1 Tax=Halovenus aranensis TaxID=890420 RepID=A0A1G8W825_9EURY|nr:hypothetical protein SAMN05216226_108121 [Halovenus aranensis]